MVRHLPVSRAVRLGRGANLVRERASRGLTLQALGDKMGFSAEQVRKYQDGRSFLGPTACWRFASALGCSFARLFDTDVAPTGVAEPAAPFIHDAADEANLDEVLARARERLTGARRTALREILLDVLEREERAAS